MYVLAVSLGILNAHHLPIVCACNMLTHLVLMQASEEVVTGLKQAGFL